MSMHQNYDDLKDCDPGDCTDAPRTALEQLYRELTRASIVDESGSLIGHTSITDGYNCAMAIEITEDSQGVSDALEAFLNNQRLGTTAALLAALNAFLKARDG